MKTAGKDVTVRQRDVTRALNLVTEVIGTVRVGELKKLRQVQLILQRMDARTGRRDPSARQQFKDGVELLDRMVKTAKKYHVQPGSASHVDGNEPSRSPNPRHRAGRR